MQKLEQLYEGKAKKVFKTDDPDVLIVDYKDDATAFNGEKKGTIVGKGVINNKMSNRVHQLLEEKRCSDSLYPGIKRQRNRRKESGDRTG